MLLELVLELAGEGVATAAILQALGAGSPLQQRRSLAPAFSILTTKLPSGPPSTAQPGSQPSRYRVGLRWETRE